MGKLIQICASEDDLFGLDGEGVVYHYNFNTNSWMRLGRVGREDGAGAGLDAAPASQGEAHEAGRPVRDRALCECGRPVSRPA